MYQSFGGFNRVSTWTRSGGVTHSHRAKEPATAPEIRSGTTPVPCHMSPAHTPATTIAMPVNPW